MQNSELLYDVIVVGAGAAGLMAAWELGLAGRKVLILEARERLGGRIHSIYEKGFDRPVELGAEFIHGELPVTFDLLQKANAPFYKVGGEFWRLENGILNREKEEIEEDKRMEKALEKLVADISVQEFLDQFFTAPKDADVYHSIKSYVEGYYSADTAKASSFYLKKEWEHGESEQFRTEGGYKLLIDYLEKQVLAAGGNIELNAPVTEITWQPGACQVVVGSNMVHCKKILITASVGVMQNGVIRFTPGLPHIEKAFGELGFGNVIKFVFQFDSAFWKVEPYKHLSKMAFVLSEQSVPTWWTQFPKNSSMLTGWLSGPKATSVKELKTEVLIDLAFESLSNIFNLPEETIKQKCTKAVIYNWCTDPYVLGSYSYETLKSAKSRKVINEGVENTVYFAGEGLYDGLDSGTVEAALSSGRETARRMIAY